jgi:simple sugar transport system permease protein
MASLIAAMLRLAVPYALTSIGETISELSGIVNIGLEGLILLGAFSATYVTYFTNNPWLGVVVATFVSALVGFVHALISSHPKGNQLLSGLGINLFFWYFTAAMLIMVWGELAAGNSPDVPKIPQIQLPFAGPFGTISPFIILTFGFGIVAYFVLYKTAIGLRLRAVGENPAAADAAGLNVARIRTIAVIIGAVLAGLSGAYLAVDQQGMFLRYMSAGRGYMALAIVVFGNWNPLTVLGGGLLFGYAEALMIRLAPALGVGIPPQLLQAIPFLLVLAILITARGRARAPSSLGKPYEKE